MYLSKVEQMSYRWNKYSIRLVPWNKYYSIIFSFWNKYYQEQIYGYSITIQFLALMQIKAQIPTLSVKVSQDCGFTSQLANTATAIERHLHKTFGFSYSCPNAPEILLNVALNTNNSNHSPTLSIYFIQIVSVDFMILLYVRRNA